MISMVTCVWNRSDLLERTLFSIHKQDHKNDFEIIIIDDGSTDNICELVDKWKFILPIRFYRTFRKGYKNVAWPQNCGVKLALGETILYSSPEVMHVGNTFDIFYEILKNKDELVVATVYDLLKEDNYWLENNYDWKTNLSLLDRFNNRRQLVGPESRREGLYFLGGWRKNTYIKVGGIDERFIYPGYDDTEFISRIKRFKIPLSFTFDYGYNIKGYHQWHPRPYEYDKKQQKLTLKSKKLYKKIIKAPLEQANRETEWGVL